MEEIEAKEAMLDRMVDTGQWSRVLTLSGELLAMDPDNSYYHRTHGFAALELNRHKRAKRHLEMAIRCDPSDPFAHYLLGKMFTKENRLLEAKKRYLNALEIDPENVWFWVEYSENCARRGDLISAREMAQQAQRLDPNNVTVTALVASFDARREDGSLADVFAEIEALKQALEHDPEDDIIHFNIGVLYLEELGDAANAEECFRRALSINPSDKDYRKYLFKALRRHDPVLRVLNFPINTCRNQWRLLESALHEPGNNLIRVLLSPFIAVLLMLLFTLWGVFLMVPAVIYEILLKKEFDKRSGNIPLNAKGFAGVYRLPFFIRFGVFLIAFAGFVWGVYWVFTSADLKPHLGNILSGLFLLGLVVGFILSARRPHQSD